MAPKKEQHDLAGNSGELAKSPPPANLAQHTFKPGQSGNLSGRPRVLLEVALKARQKLDAHRQVLEDIAADKAQKSKDRISAIEVHRGMATGETLKVRIDDTPADDERSDLELLRELADEMGFELVPKGDSKFLERVGEGDATPPLPSPASETDENASGGA